MSANQDFQQPDFDQMKETVLMLNLAVGQICFSMKQGDESVDTLTQSFTQIIETMNRVEEIAVRLDEQCKEKTEILNRFKVVRNFIQGIIIAFQFYDRLSQRIDHVGISLTSLANILGDSERIYKQESWQSLQELIRAKYTMREENMMFEAIIKGVPVEDALKILSEKTAKGNDDEDDIILF
jgi:hypothetical protein